MSSLSRAEVARDHQAASAIADAQLSPLGFDSVLTPAERTAFLGRLAVSEQEARAVLGPSRTLLQQAQAIGLKPPVAELVDMMRREREARGACVVDVKLPLT